MKKRFSEEQIIRVLKEAEGAEGRLAVCRKHGITEQTYYRWRSKYGGMSVPDVRRLRELEKENARLKKLVADRSLEIDVMKELLGKNL